MCLDVSAIRAAYPALADGYAYLDGAAGTQVPASVIQAIGVAYANGLGNSGGAFPASARSDAITADCRRAVAALIGGEPDGVILGPNMTTLTYRMAGTLAKDWRPGDEVIVSRLDHDANIRPWVQAAAAGRRGGAVGRAGPGHRRAAGRAVRRPAHRRAPGWWPSPRPATSSAPGRTCLRSPPRARAAGALSYVDGVHATPHGPVDIAGAGRGLLRDQRLQVVRAAHRRGRGRPGAAGHAAPGQAGARTRRSARSF